jgi:ZIP family zinc transporter
VDWFYGLNPIWQALLATLGTWGVTAAGAALVLPFGKFSQKYLDASLGMAAGVMIAASCWSLINPSIEMSQRLGYGAYSWAPPLVGFLLGAGFLRLTDRLLPHLHLQLAASPEGLKSHMRRTTLLVLAITMHNIPEGLAVGVAFGAAGLPGLTPEVRMAELGGAVALAVGIGLQNFPEGSAVAFPLKREGLSRGRAFFYGQLSAIVEPIAGVLGAALVIAVTPALPYALAFAAGAMIFVATEELIPESQANGNVDLSTMGVIGGFAVMMALDVGLS